MTFRAQYLREGRQRTATFAAYSLPAATQWAQRYCDRIAAQLCNVAAVRPRLTLE